MDDPTKTETILTDLRARLLREATQALSAIEAACPLDREGRRRIEPADARVVAEPLSLLLASLHEYAQPGEPDERRNTPEQALLTAIKGTVGDAGGTGSRSSHIKGGIDMAVWAFRRSLADDQNDAEKAMIFRQLLYGPVKKCLADCGEQYACQALARFEDALRQYQRTSSGEPPATGTARGDPPPPAPTVAAAEQYGYLSPSELAQQHGVDAEALRKRLERWRVSHMDGWIENTERKSTEAQFLYSPSGVAEVIQKAKEASGRTSGNRPAV